ncbi:MAG TPA: deoxyribose-phosphate aldolase [Rhodothermia bacterium]|nr:deoxyribose-phosphate aldolase [Rhodothermia bacterium]
MGTYTPGYIPTVDQIAAEARAASFTTRSIKKSSKKQVLEMIVRMIDLTTLEGMDTPGKVRTLCRKARQPLIDRSVPPVAAVCVYPSMVAVAKDALRGSTVKIASVATSFPSGQTYLEERLREVEHVVADGADEVDMVINRGAFLSGDYQRAFDEIKATKAACGQAHLKVILETGELGSYDQVAKASHLAMDAGADFIKTSTGKVTPAATMPVSLVMLEAVRSHYLNKGRQVGFKPAGGIRTAKQAWHYLVMVKETVGDLWLSPDWFRFGASTLLNDVLMQWERLETGHYQSSVYYSLD